MKTVLFLITLLWLLPMPQAGHAQKPTEGKADMALKDVCGEFSIGSSPYVSDEIILWPDGTFARKAASYIDSNFNMNHVGGIVLEHRIDFGTTRRSNPTFEYDASGTFTLDHDVVHLKTLKVEKDDNFDYPLQQQCFLIAWGKRLCLIPQEEMLRFCNDINAGYEPYGPNFAMYLLRAGGVSEIVTGSPQVPAEWKPYLLPKPVIGQILTVKRTGKEDKAKDGTDNGEIVEVTINVGAEQGLRKGMRLYIAYMHYAEQNYPFKGQFATVREVSPKQCVAEFIVGKGDLPPAVGESVATQPRTGKEGHPLGYDGGEMLSALRR